MKRITLIAVLAALVSTYAVGQSEEKGSIMGGYQYMSIGTQNFQRQSANGWVADAAVNPTKHLALAANISGVYHGDFLGFNGLTGHLYNFLFGPRAYFGTGKAAPFAEALFGFDRVGLIRNGISQTNTSVAMAVGRGLDYNIGPHVGIRAFELDYLLARAPFNAIGITNNTNNIRLATGVKLRF